jgi:hypothetical protein
MTIQYKVQGYDLTTSALTVVLAINSQSVAIVKEISVANDNSSAVEVNYYLNDFSESKTYKFYHTKVPADSNDNAVGNVLVLEEGDSISFQASSSNVISGQISYALLNRSQQNG